MDPIGNNTGDEWVDTSSQRYTAPKNGWARSEKRARNFPQTQIPCAELIYSVSLFYLGAFYLSASFAR